MLRGGRGKINRATTTEPSGCRVGGEQEGKTKEEDCTAIVRTGKEEFGFNFPLTFSAIIAVAQLKQKTIL